jgi:hypothetical protein
VFGGEEKILVTPWLEEYWFFYDERVNLLIVHPG